MELESHKKRLCNVDIKKKTLSRDFFFFFFSFLTDIFRTQTEIVGFYIISHVY